MDLPLSLSGRADTTTSRPRLAHAPGWRCAGILLAVAAISCAGDEFETGAGDGGAGATSSSSTTTASGDGGSNPGATTSSSVTSGEGGSAVSTGEGGGGEGGGENEGGGGSGPVGDCDPELSGELPIPASCGVFVDPNRAEGEVGTGAKDDPFRSINDAVAAVAERDDRRIYVTESATNEHVVIDVEGLIVHGGLSNQWVFRADGRTHVLQPTGDAHVAAVEVRDCVADVSVHGFRVEAKSTSSEGESSIAVLVDNATLRLRRTELVAHDGAAGADGVVPTDDIGPIGVLYDEELSGESGSAPPQGVTTGGSGGSGGINGRPGCDSRGGRGGNGAASFGVGDDYSAGDGLPGLRDGLQTAPGGQGAEVEGGVFDSCTGGETPDPSESTGTNGESAAGVGTINPDDGFVHEAATDGERGRPGPAGGGGGGGPRQPERGYGGGGGGAGGCGGFGGRAGQSGGASIGLLVFDSTIYFDENVTISAGAGGDGGDGALGQFGAAGGRGAAVPLGSPSVACQGGNGRPGERGGVGGAGAGGHSLGVAYLGTTIIGQATIGVSAPGDAGAPASDATGMADGGLAVPLYQF